MHGVPVLALTWQVAALVAVLLAGVAAVLRRRTGPPRRRGAPAAAAREAALVLGLYALWQLVRLHSVTHVAGGGTHGHQVWALERALHLPAERAVQRALLGHPLLVQAANVYYVAMHFPALLACLVWLFARHRDRYPRVRTALVLLTGASLLLQVVPVAPPRLLPDLGVVDTATVYGQSVYPPGGAGIADQLSAMPSVHVGWALLVAVAVVTASRSRWRWLVVGHPVLTVAAVVVTGNHFWLDAVAAGGLLAVAWPAAGWLGGLGRPLSGPQGARPAHAGPGSRGGSQRRPVEGVTAGAP